MAARIRKQEHYQHGDESTAEKIRLAAAHTAPGPVGKPSDERLHYHAHKGRQYPEETQLVRVGTESGENATYVCALERIGDLDAEEAETQVYELAKC